MEHPIYFLKQTYVGVFYAAAHQFTIVKQNCLTDTDQLTEMHYLLCLRARKLSTKTFLIVRVQRIAEGIFLISINPP